MIPSISAELACVFLTLLILTAALWRPRRRFHPGPKGIPVLGNVLDVPKDYAWLTYQDWSRRYGKQSHFWFVICTL